MLIVWNVNSSIVNTRPLEVLIIKVCHCNVLCFLVQHVPNMQLRWFGITKSTKKSWFKSHIRIIKNKKVIQVFLHQTQPEQTIVGSYKMIRPFFLLSKLACMMLSNGQRIRISIKHTAQLQVYHTAKPSTLHPGHTPYYISTLTCYWIA